jgi:hypothetical protein
MRWPLLAREMMRASADGKGVWSWSPDAGIKPVERFNRRRRLTSPVLRRERAISRKTVAQGVPSDFGVPVVTLRASFFRLHARQWVRRAPGIPCALSFERDTNDASLGHFVPRG